MASGVIKTFNIETCNLEGGNQEEKVEMERPHFM